LPYRRLLLTLCLLLLALPLSAAELRGKVTWIYDGDTLLIDKIGKVRLLGIDTPESDDSSRDRYYLDRFKISRQKLRQIARDAKYFNIEQVKGKQVRLSFDKQEKDQYGRLLAYLYLPDDRLLNQLLLERGLASVFRRFSFSKKKAFLAAEKQARNRRLGLWQQ
jgi:micrococcal nuclease